MNNGNWFFDMLAPLFGVIPALLTGLFAFIGMITGWSWG